MWVVTPSCWSPESVLSVVSNIGGSKRRVQLMHPLSLSNLYAVVGKILPNNRLAPPLLGLTPLVWEILDPPLTVDRHLMQPWRFHSLSSITERLTTYGYAIIALYLYPQRVPLRSHSQRQTWWIIKYAPWCEFIGLRINLFCLMHLWTNGLELISTLDLIL